MVVTRTLILILTHIRIHPVHLVAHHRTLRVIHHPIHHRNHLANHHPIRLVVVLHEMGFEFSGLDQEVEFMFLAHPFKAGRKCHNQMQQNQLTMDLYIQV